jgi:hypothetical protein
MERQDIVSSNFDKLLSAPCEDLRRLRASFAAPTLSQHTAPPQVPDVSPLPFPLSLPPPPSPSTPLPIPRLPPQHAMGSLAPSVKDLLRSWVEDVKASGSMHEETSSGECGELQNVCESRRAGEKIPPCADGDAVVEANVEVLADGVIAGRLFSAEGPPPVLLSDNFIDDGGGDDGSRIVGFATSPTCNGSDERRSEPGRRVFGAPHPVAPSTFPGLPDSQQRRPRGTATIAPFIVWKDEAEVPSLAVDQGRRGDRATRSRSVHIGDEKGDFRASGEGEDERKERTARDFGSAHNRFHGYLTGISKAAGVWEEPLEAFELDPNFDYDNCPLTPHFDLEKIAERYRESKQCRGGKAVVVSMAKILRTTD